MPLIPKELSFFDDFDAQCEKTVASCRAFLALAENPSQMSEVCEKIRELEQGCNQITHEIIEKLHRTFIAPFDRNDIYRLVTQMDGIMDSVEAAAMRMQLFEMRETRPELADLARSLVKAAEKTMEAVASLRN